MLGSILTPYTMFKYARGTICVKWKFIASVGMVVIFCSCPISYHCRFKRIICVYLIHKYYHQYAYWHIVTKTPTTFSTPFLIFWPFYNTVIEIICQPLLVIMYYIICFTWASFLPSFVTLYVLMVVEITRFDQVIMIAWSNIINRIEFFCE